MIDAKENVTPEPTAHGWPCLVCPRCLSSESTISIDLDDLDRCVCEGCDEQFTVADIRGIIAVWAPMLLWLEMAPRREE